MNQIQRISKRAKDEIIGIIKDRAEFFKDKPIRKPPPLSCANKKCDSTPSDLGIYFEYIQNYTDAGLGMTEEEMDTFFKSEEGCFFLCLRCCNELFEWNKK